jgi:hypothetical protein
MDASQFESCLGMTEDAPEVKVMLAELGIVKKLKLSSEGNVRLRLDGHGLLLTFRPIEPRSSILKFNGVQFYSDAEEGFTTYAGILPGGLAFNDTSKQARAKLGKPTEIMKDFRLDHWISDGRQTTVRYRKTLDGIAYVMRGFARADGK